MTAEQLKAIVRIVEHSYDDERDHYWEMRQNFEETGHIFESLQEVMKWLKTVPETADFADRYLAETEQFLNDVA